MTLVRRLFSIAAWFFLALAPLPSSVGMAADRPLRYHSEPEITAWLKALPLRDPNLVQYRSIGTSNQGRDLGLVTLTAGPVQLRNPKPAIIINATHHGDEKIATESALHFIETLIVDQDKPEVTAMLASRTAMPRAGSPDRQLYQRGHEIARTYLQAHADELGIDDIEVAATVSTRVVGNFAPWIALSVTGDDERERFIAEVVRMLSQWIGS